MEDAPVVRRSRDDRETHERGGVPVGGPRSCEPQRAGRREYTQRCVPVSTWLAPAPQRQPAGVSTAGSTRQPRFPVRSTGMRIVSKGLRAALFVLSCGLLACGGSTSPTTPTTPPTPKPAAKPPENFPADASAVHYHPIHHAAFGPIYGSGCPDNGACGCGDATDLAEEFTCQIDHLAANDIPITVYLFDGSAWSQEHSTADNTCAGPDCCSWKLGDGVDPAPRAATGSGGSSTSGAGATTTSSTGGPRPGWGGTSSASTSTTGPPTTSSPSVSEFMQSAIPGDWECVAKAYQNREPSTSNTGPQQVGERRLRGRPFPRLRGLKEAVTRILAKARLHPGPVRRAHGLLLPQHRASRRGGLLPAPALRGAAAGDGPHPVRQQRPLATRVRARPRPDLPLLGLAAQGARALLLQLRLPDVRDARPCRCCGRAR